MNQDPWGQQRSAAAREVIAERGLTEASPLVEIFDAVAEVEHRVRPIPEALRTGWPPSPETISALWDDAERETAERQRAHEAQVAEARAERERVAAAREAHRNARREALAAARDARSIVASGWQPKGALIQHDASPTPPIHVFLASPTGQEMLRAAKRKARRDAGARHTPEE